MFVLQTTRVAMIAAALLAGPALAASPIPVAEVERGQIVTVSGEVVRILDEDEFRLRDDTGVIDIYVGYGNRLALAQGDRVTVTGRADDDALPGTRPEIYADTITLASGEVIELK